MNYKYVYAFFGIMFLILAGSQIYNTYSFESSFGSYEDYIITWQNMPEDARSPHPYPAYEAMWREHANVNPVIPAFILAAFFGYVAHLFYDDWANNGYKNKRKYLGVVPYEV
jgi:hypothetical protein